jgi:hypothetical protein
MIGDDKRAVNGPMRKLELARKQRLRCGKDDSCELDAVVDEVDVIVEIGCLRRAFRVFLVSTDILTPPVESHNVALFDWPAILFGLYLVLRAICRA